MLCPYSLRLCEMKKIYELIGINRVLPLYFKKKEGADRICPPRLYCGLYAEIFISLLPFRV